MWFYQKPNWMETLTSVLKSNQLITLLVIINFAWNTNKNGNGPLKGRDQEEDEEMKDKLGRI